MRTLDTPRLVLRPLQVKDEAFYCGLYTDPETMRYICVPWSMEESRLAFRKALARTHDANNDHRYWTITRHTDNHPTGLIGWHRLETEGSGSRIAEIGAILTSDARSRGIGVEAAQALMTYAFGQSIFDVLQTQHAVENSQAATAVSRLGFERQEGKTDHPTMVNWLISRDRWAMFNADP